MGSQTCSLPYYIFVDSSKARVRDSIIRMILLKLNVIDLLKKVFPPPETTELNLVLIIAQHLSILLLSIQIV